MKISTDEKKAALDFVSEYLDEEYAMVFWRRDASGCYHVAINTEIEPTPASSAGTSGDSIYAAQRALS